MKNPQLLEWIIEKMNPLPLKTFSIKIRSGYSSLEDLNPILKVLKHPKVSFVIIHPRLVVDYFKTPADHSVSAQVVQFLTPKPVIVNGDLACPIQAVKTLRATKAHGIMIGRGAIKNPWIFKQIQALFHDETQFFHQISSEEFIQVYEEFLSLYGHRLSALKEILNHLSFTLDKTGALQRQLCRTNSLKQFDQIIRLYCQEHDSFILSQALS